MKKELISNEEVAQNEALLLEKFQVEELEQRFEMGWGAKYTEPGPADDPLTPIYDAAELWNAGQ